MTSPFKSLRSVSFCASVATIALIHGTTAAAQIAVAPVWNDDSAAPVVFQAQDGNASTTIASGTDVTLRGRGEDSRSLFDRRGDNAGFRTDELGKRFETYVRQIAAARGFTTSLNEKTSGEGAFAANVAWWTSALRSSVRSNGSMPQSYSDLVGQALANSLQLGVFAELPAIRSTGVEEAKGRFKAEFFTEARYSDRNEPTTSIAQTRGSERLTDSDLSTEFGVRSRLKTGGELTVAQRFSDYSTNQVEYNPREQARSRTVVGLVQPLLRESGTVYNNSIQKIAELETTASLQEFSRQAESHLLEINRTYWTLYLARSIYLQQKKSRDAVADIVSRIASRENVDSATLQVSRARAALADRDSELVRAKSAISNSEARLKALINSPELNAVGSSAEIIPTDMPRYDMSDITEADLVQDALNLRPEIQQSFIAYRTALLREGMAANESLPQLDLVMEGSLSGRDADWKLGGAFGNGVDHKPGYQVGVRLAVPLGKDERKVRYERRQIESNQQSLQVRAAVETVMLELEVSANEYGVAHREMLRRADSVKFALEDQRVLRERWSAGISAGQSGTDGLVYLDQLLNAQERVASAERQFSEAQVTYQVSSANLARARGKLLSDLGLKVAQVANEKGLPVYKLMKL
jgi:outer membrane protein TolC